MLADCLLSLFSLIGDTDASVHESLRRYSLSLFEEVGLYLGWEVKGGERETHSMWRSRVLEVLVRAGHLPSIAEAKARFTVHHNLYIFLHFNVPLHHSSCATRVP